MSDPQAAHPEERVEVADLQERAVDGAALVRLLEAVLSAEGRAGVMLSLTLVDDAAMAELHQQHMGEPDPTDVLAFPLSDGPTPPGMPELLGEIVVCTDVAAREADERGLPFAEEVARYAVHGLLHLLGYDDHEEPERTRMHARQEEHLRARWEGHL